jgi:hypothetical protein
MAFIVLYMLYYEYKVFKSGLKKYLYNVLAALIVFAGAFTYLMLTGALNAIFSSFGESMKWLLSSNYAEGHLYDTATRYDYKYEADLRTNIFNNFVLSFFINNWYNILMLYLKRMVAFIGVWILNFDSGSIIGMIKYILFALTPFIFGIYCMKKNKIMKKAALLLFVILSVVFFCVFFFMDASYRYRVPSLPFIGIVMAYGVDRLMALGIRYLADKPLTRRRKVLSRD